MKVALLYPLLIHGTDADCLERLLAHPGIKVSKDMQIKVESFTGELPGDIDTMPEAPEFEIK